MKEYSQAVEGAKKILSEIEKSNNYGDIYCLAELLKTHANYIRYHSQSKRMKEIDK